MRAVTVFDGAIFTIGDHDGISVATRNARPERSARRLFNGTWQ
jgi:hypothetical protein